MPVSFLSPCESSQCKFLRNTARHRMATMHAMPSFERLRTDERYRLARNSVGALLLVMLVLVPATVTVYGGAGFGSKHAKAEAPKENEVNLLAGQWDYLPGAERQPDGMHIRYIGRTIVEQDGSGGQPNPPVNQYGTRLQTDGDFSMEADIKDLHGTGSLRLYDEVPVIQDEFRVEPKSLDIQFDQNAVTASFKMETCGSELAP
jgi:hypothetical protein